MTQLMTILELIRVVIIFLFIFILIPQFFLHIADTTSILDRVFMGMTSASVYLAITAHILALTKLMDVLSFILIFLILSAIFIKRDKEREFFLTRVISKRIFFFELFDLKKKDVLRRIFTQIKIRPWVTSQLKKIWQYPFLSFVTVSVFIASLIVRLKYSVLHAAYPHIDMYLHLKWIKGIMANNLFYNDEIYPKGMHSVYAAMAKLTFLDPYILVRFIGPIIGILIVLAVYNLSYKVTNNRYAALLSMTIYGMTDFGLTNLGFFPSQLFRQAATMSQELGMLFVLLGLGYLIDYFMEKNKYSIFAFYSCVFLVFIIHSYAAMYLVLWTAVFMLIVLFYRKITFKKLLLQVAILLLLIIITFVPLLIGKLIGAEYHKSSIVMITDISGLKFSLLMVGQYLKDVFIPKDPYMYSIILGLLLCPVVTIISTKRYIHLKKIFFTVISLSTFTTFLLFNLPSLFINLDLPLLFEKVRTGPFLCVLVPILIAQLVDLISDLISGEKTEKGESPKQFVINHALILASVAYVIAIVFLNFFPWNVFYKNIEYDAAAENYLRIKSDFFKETRSLDWTIIGPDTQLAEVMGYGWHQDIYRFVRNFSLEQLIKPSFKFPIPTHYIYVFIEKKPMFSGRAINSLDAENDLEPEGTDAFMQYYMDGKQRAIMEAKAWALVEAYKSSHKGVTVYYEDSDMIIYKIYQEKLI